jgi:hypothetical protein
MILRRANGQGTPSLWRTSLPNMSLQRTPLRGAAELNR